MMENPTFSNIPLSNFLELEGCNPNGNSNQVCEGDSEDSNGSSFETTLIEIEDLLGDEEELQSFLRAMQTSPKFDLNSNEVNEVKEKSVPIIDLCSDSESEEDKFFSKSDHAITVNVSNPENFSSISEKDIFPSNPCSSFLPNFYDKNLKGSESESNCDDIQAKSLKSDDIKAPVPSLKVTEVEKEFLLDENSSFSYFSDHGSEVSPKTEEYLLSEAGPEIEVSEEPAVEILFTASKSTETVTEAVKPQISLEHVAFTPTCIPNSDTVLNDGGDSNNNNNFKDSKVNHELLSLAKKSGEADKRSTDNIEPSVLSKSCKAVSEVVDVKPAHIPDIPDTSVQEVPSDIPHSGGKVVEDTSVVAEERGPHQSENTSVPAKPSWAQPFISTDEAENADNNDPEWDLLRKLETDEERYRVVRQKWRQLTIPDPRRDLTRHNYKKLGLQNSRESATVSELIDDRLSRKRRMSENASDEGEHASKKRKTSCSQLFEDKIKDLRREMHDEFAAIINEKERALVNLSRIQQKDHDRVRNMQAPPHIVQLHAEYLCYQQRKEVNDLTEKYKAKIDVVSQEKVNNITILQNASQEILTFNKFYQNLDNSNDDHMHLTEEERLQFEETELMYDMFDKFYVG